MVCFIGIEKVFEVGSFRVPSTQFKQLDIGFGETFRNTLCFVKTEIKKCYFMLLGVPIAWKQDFSFVGCKAALLSLAGCC